MKPDWKDAPEWANWLAMDVDGGWHWYDMEPFWDGYNWVMSGFVSEPASEEFRKARDSIEARPSREASND